MWIRGPSHTWIGRTYTVSVMYTWRRRCPWTCTSSCPKTRQNALMCCFAFVLLLLFCFCVVAFVWLLCCFCFANARGPGCSASGADTKSGGATPEAPAPWRAAAANARRWRGYTQRWRGVDQDTKSGGAMIGLRRGHGIRSRRTSPNAARSCK